MFACKTWHNEHLGYFTCFLNSITSLMMPMHPPACLKSKGSVIMSTDKSLCLRVEKWYIQFFGIMSSTTTCDILVYSGQKSKKFVIACWSILLVRKILIIIRLELKSKRWVRKVFLMTLQTHWACYLYSLFCHLLLLYHFIRLCNRKHQKFLITMLPKMKQGKKC